MNENVGDFHFSSNFDSGNLARVEKHEKNCQEFNLWTSPDCANTEFENGNRTWFYFKVQGPPNVNVKFNIMNLNRQAKLYSQGMRPLYKIIPYQGHWERIKDKPICSIEDQNFLLSFKFTMPSEEDAAVYFAFCYPYSYSDLQDDLHQLDLHFASKDGNIFYQRELLCHSLDHRRVDLITVTRNGDETRKNKPVVFISARVHPGETPSSFVLKGFLEFILKEDDIRAQKLRENFIFMLVPMLNPDGVYRGHYRTDNRGINLNRVYLETNSEFHPTIAATKKLLLDLAYEDTTVETNSLSSLEYQVKETLTVQPDEPSGLDDSITHWPSTFKQDGGRTSFAGIQFSSSPKRSTPTPTSTVFFNGSGLEGAEEADVSAQYFDVPPTANTSIAPLNTRSRLFAYIDLHGHASKRGIFIYGNHFDDVNQQIECLLLPKLISLNSQHFDFWACNFSEKNMKQRDKRDGLSKEGSGRVAISKLTGIPRSYTLECNYNTGRMRNILSPLPADKYPLFHATTGDNDEGVEIPFIQRRRTISAGPSTTEPFAPPLPYDIPAFEEVGEALAVSLLDLVGANPLSRLSQSNYGDVEGVRQWIRLHCVGQRRFPFVEAEGDDESAGSHLPHYSAVKSVPTPQQVVQLESHSTTTAAAAGESMVKRPPSEKSPFKPKSENCVRLRQPWPGSPRLKDPPNQSPKQHTSLDFSPTSPTYPLFPKQLKSPSSARRLPRKRTIKKAKPTIKKEVTDSGKAEVDLQPTSPTRKLLKRKRRKSRTASESSTTVTKEKRTFLGTTGENLMDLDFPQPSTSGSAKLSNKPTLVRKKLMKKRSVVLKKKTKRISLNEA